MKYFETKFEDYINQINISNLHPELENLTKNIKNKYNLQYHNLIYYGSPGIGKYSQALNFIEYFSESKLKYERKINIPTIKNTIYNIKNSDVHYEVDMDLLGCNAKIIWNDIFKAIIASVQSKKNNTGIILCKNFHKIHNELLDIFYSYMKSLKHENVNISFILLTETLSFIPYSILNKSFVINVKKPSNTAYKNIFNIKPSDMSMINSVNNIKDIKGNLNSTDVDNKFINTIIEHIINNDVISLEFRNNIYNIFIYNLDVHDTIYKIIEYFIINKHININKTSKVIKFLNTFLKYYNNNYRPIYHLERFILYLTNQIHDIE